MRRYCGIFVAVVVVAVSLSIVTGAIAANGGHGAAKRGKHAAKKKKHSKKKSSVNVKCASTLYCKSHSGPTGPAGPQGAPGAPGAPGAKGYAIVARARSLGPLVTAECVVGSPPGTTCPNQDDPLAGNTWTQQPTESDHLIGSVTYTQPSSACTQAGSGSPPAGQLTLNVLLDGKVVGSGFVPNSSAGNAGSTSTISIQFGGFYSTDTSDVLETGTANNHTLTVSASDTCDAPAGAHYTVNSVALDVEAYS
jgi:hypothetical protein